MSDAHKTLLSLLVICTVVALGCLPLIVYGPQRGEDLHFHLAWSHAFAQQIFQGEFYPRWLMDMNAGAGSPTFFFYGPIAYYISTVAIAMCRDCSPVVQLGIADFMVVLASALSFFYFARRHTGRFPAVLGAILYAFAPYHFGMDLLVRQAFGEATAYIWIPLVFAAIDKLVAGVKAEVGLAMAYALLVMTHLPAALLSSSFFLIYALTLAWRRKRWHLLTRVLLSLALGLLIAGCYLIPALTTLKFIYSNQWWTPFFDYSRWYLLDGVTAPNERIEGQLLNMALGNTLLFAVSWYLALRWCSPELKPAVIAMVVIFFGCWFFMTRPSTFVWEWFPPLRKIQFPFRFMVLQDFAMCAAVTLAIAAAWERKDRLAVCAGAALCLGTTLWVLYVATANYQAHRVLWGDAKNRTYYEQITTLAADGGPHIPAAVKVPRDVLVLRMQKEKVLIDQTHGDVKVIQWSPRYILLGVDARQESRVILRQIYYPGWEVVNESTHERLTISPQPEFGLIQFMAQPGSYQISVRLRGVWQERLGWASTAVGVSLALVLLISNRKATQVQQQPSDVVAKPSERHKEKRRKR